MSTSATTHRFGRFMSTLTAVAVVVVALPATLAFVALRRFAHVSPLHGMNGPWRWSIDDVRSWARRLTDGLGSTAALVDLFFRVALVVGWLCFALLLYSLVDELLFQARHGMPSARHRRLGGFGSLGRKLATVLVTVLPLAVSATPALAGQRLPGPTAGVVHHRVADLPDLVSSTFTMPASASPTVVSDLGSGWSLVEVRRGDSVWAIADRVADGHDVAAIARQIVSANLGTMMNDGHRFSTPALIEPGWLLNVPVAATTMTVQQTAVSRVAGHYTVVAGDSYWKIAEEHLDPSASGHEIAVYTSELIRINAPTFGHDDERLIRPGDVLLLSEVETAPIAVPAADAPVVVVPAANTMPPVVVTLPLPLPPPPLAVTPIANEPSTAVLPVAVSSATASAPATIEPTVAERVGNLSREGFPMKQGLAAAVLLSGGAIAVLDARRRQQLRSARVGARLLAPSPEAVETEVVLRSLTAAEQLARVDLALRSAAPALARQHALVFALEISEEGDVRLFTDRPAPSVADLWLFDSDGGSWRLPASVSLTDLADASRGANQPCPAIIHIGASAGGQLFVDLEAIGLLSVEAPLGVAASIVRCAAASLAVSPFAESSRVFTVGIEPEAGLGNSNVEVHESLQTAVDAVRATVGSIASATSGGVTTFALRATAVGGEAWEPSLLLAIGIDDPDELASLSSIAGGGGRGVGIIVDRLVVGSGLVLRAVDDDFVLEPLGRRVTPVGLSVGDVSSIDDLLAAADQPLLVDAHDDEPTPILPAESSPRTYEFLVQVLGPIGVQAADGTRVVFDRSKAQELVVWLSQHRRRPTRTSARTALWDLAVRDATFSNVVSDARRAMAKVVTPASGQEWIGRTMNEDLPLHDLVICDLDLLADRFAAAKGLERHAAIAVLRPGVDLLNGMPFEGSSYLWPDAEGITSACVLLATSAAAELAGHYLAIGDIDGVFWATGQGLKVLAGHEELIALRMRAHALHGDLAGVRSEWDSYERAVNADTWAAAEPSPKLVDLRRELLAPSLAS